MVNKKISLLKALCGKMPLDELILKNGEKELLVIFNDMCVKNIDRKEEIKKHNKSLLERLLVISREYKNLK
jgi:hypothetical protein